MTTPVRPADAEDRWALTDEREFLRRSLDDADREHAAGDLDDTDHALLRRRDEARLAEVEAHLAAIDVEDAQAADTTPAHDGPPPTTRRLFRRPRRRVWVAVVGSAALVAGVVVLVVALTTSRLPGQVATGGVTLSHAKLVDQQLAQAAVLVEQGNPSEALAVYQEVLSEEPDDATALAEGGWLEWESGGQASDSAIEAKGAALVARAVHADPGFYAGHLYLGTIRLDKGDAQAAVAQYREYLSDHPPASWTKDFAKEIRTAYTAAGQPVPADVPAG